MTQQATAAPQQETKKPTIHFNGATAHDVIFYPTNDEAGKSITEELEHLTILGVELEIIQASKNGDIYQVNYNGRNSKGQLVCKKTTIFPLATLSYLEVEYNE